MHNFNNFELNFIFIIRLNLIYQNYKELQMSLRFHLSANQYERYIIGARPLLLKITKGKGVRSFGEVRFDIKELWNKNVFIDDPNFVGGKTGYLTQLKYNALFIFRFLTDDEKIRDIVIILLGSEDNRNDTQKIYKWLRKNYHLSPTLTIKD